MRFARGTVVDGKLVVDEGEPLADGTRVTILALEPGDEPVLTPRMKAELRRSIGEIASGDWVELEEALRELRS